MKHQDTVKLYHVMMEEPENIQAGKFNKAPLSHLAETATLRSTTSSD